MALPTSRPEPSTVTIAPPATLTMPGTTELTLATATSSVVIELLLQSCPFNDTSTVVLPMIDATDMHSTTPADTENACAEVVPPIKHDTDDPSSTPAPVTIDTVVPPVLSTTDGSTRLTDTTALYVY
jgi:hypothetical protein